ncbi:helix-turn-helix transcriptional regulator [Patescibacteria group bacterium]|nr:helix-turn-helix transcriptional regulator [Patescibacteria group bacterium]
MKKKLTNYEKHLKKELKDKEFKILYEKEKQRFIIALEIFKLREKYGYTQKDLAKKLNTTQSVIARIEKGNQNLTINYLNKIAKIFDKSVKISFL